MTGRRDQAELRRIYRAHVAAVYAFFGYSVSADTAEDLTSATFERVIRSWPSYDPAIASERTWILTIARNLLTDHYRRAGHRRTVSSDEHPALLAERPADDPRLDALAERSAVATMLASLRPREREVLALRFGADLPADDVAALLDLTPANVHQIASRALRRLRAELEEVSDSA